MIGIRDIPYDETLPQLSKALDGCTMKEMFQATLFETEQSGKQCKITDCEVVYVKYKPKMACTVCYKVVIQDIYTNQEYSQLHSAKIFEPGNSTRRFQKAQTLPLVQPRYGKPLVHIPEFDMIVWSFPNDRKLEALAQLTNPAIVQEKFLPELLVRLFGQGWIITCITADVMNYVPWYSCTIKITAQIHSQQLNEEKSLTLYAKTYSDPESGARANAIMHELWETAERKSGEFRMARPVWYDSTHKIFWQLAVPGKTLLQVDLRSPYFANLLEKVGCTIAGLHMLRVTSAQPIRFEDLVSRLRHTHLELSLLKPSVIHMLHTIVTLLVDQAEGLGEQPETTLHGDLHLKNFIVDGTSVTMIDLDEVGRGSPFHDVGSCVAFVLYQGLELGIFESQIYDLVGGFIQEYRRHVTWDVPEPVLRWYVVAALIEERVTRCLKKAKPGTVQQVERLVQLAYRLASGDQKIPMEGTRAFVDESPSPTQYSDNGMR